MSGPHAPNPYTAFIHTTGKKRHLDLILSDRILENYVAYNGSKSGRHFEFAETMRTMTTHTVDFGAARTSHGTIALRGGDTSSTQTRTLPGGSLTDHPHRRNRKSHNAFLDGGGIGDAVVITMSRKVNNVNAMPRFG